MPCVYCWTARGVDVVLVLTSMTEHGRLAGAAPEAGKHVLVEKPVASVRCMRPVSNGGSAYHLHAGVGEFAQQRQVVAVDDPLHGREATGRTGRSVILDRGRNADAGALTSPLRCT